MSLIELRNISKTYGNGENKVEALKNISLTINKGEMLSIVGTSGSGKSTLLNILGCLDRPSLGEYYINNELIINLKDSALSRLRNKTFGFVVQYFALLEDYTVEQNIIIPLEYTKIKIKKKDRKKEIKKLTSLLKIDDKLKKYPKELSGGQCQRVAIARALINEPSVILADEPTGALDRKTSEEVMEIFRELNRNGKTIIIVTHDENISKKCDRIIKIEDGMVNRKKIILIICSILILMLSITGYFIYSIKQQSERFGKTVDGLNNTEVIACNSSYKNINLKINTDNTRSNEPLKIVIRNPKENIVEDMEIPPKNKLNYTKNFSGIKGKWKIEFSRNSNKDTYKYDIQFNANNK